MSPSLVRAACVLLLATAAELARAQDATPPKAPAPAPAAAASAPGHKSQISLQGDKSPTDTPWTQPATLDLTRSEGKTVGTFDGYLTWKPALLENIAKPSDCLPGQSALAISAYWHKDTDPDSLKNDRGLELQYSSTLWSNSFADIAQAIKAVCAKPGVTPEEAHAAYADARDANNLVNFGSGKDWNWGWSADVQVGKTLTASNPTSSASTPKTYFDKDKDRETIALGGYVGFQFGLPPLPASDQQDAKNVPEPQVAFLKWKTSVYSDDASGGQGPSGRLSGVQASVAGTWYPLGVETAWKVGGKSLVPSLTASAQVEKDVTSTGSRPQSTYRLYSMGLTIEAGAAGKSDGHIVPSLTLQRSAGADLLKGRANSAKTELTFGLTF